ncbi:MAG: AraC family transcriptional regulator [Bauldia sp.]
MHELLEQMCEVADRHAKEARSPTSIPGLTLYNIRKSVHVMHVLYNPRICIILRGSKTVSLGDAPFHADAATFLLVTVDIPVASRVFVSGDGRSYLSLTLDLDRGVLAEIMQKLPLRPMPAMPPAGLAAARVSDELLEPFARLLNILDRPDEIEFLRPLIVREIHYRLLKSGLADPLVQFVMSGSHLWRVGKATSWIKAHYNEPMSIDGLAELAGMSVTSFHRHFKAVTLMTPFQYRTQVRLQEARRMLLGDHATTGTVGVAVGYDSQSQFSREYKRMFGAPPATDAARLMGAA